MLRLLCICLLALLCIPAVGPGQGPEPKKTPPPAQVDRSGDPLPLGAVARLGTTRFRHQGPVHFVGYSGDGGVVVTASGDTTLRFWDARAGKEMRKLQVMSNMRRFPFQQGPSVLLSGDGKTLVLGADDGDCTVVDVSAGKTRREFKTQAEAGGRFRGQEGPQSSLSRDGRLLVSVDGDRNGRGGGKISVWDTATGKLARQMTPKNKGGSFAAATLSPDGKTLVGVETLAEGKKDGPGKPLFRFWDMGSGKELRSIVSPLDSVNGLLFGADGKTLMVRDQGGQSVRLLDAGTTKEIRQFAAKPGPVRGVLLSPDHKTVFVAGPKQITQFDVQTGKELREFPVAATGLEEFAGELGLSNRHSMALSPDGKTLAVPDRAAVAFWDVQSGKEVRAWDGHRDRIDSVAFGAGGKLMLTGSADSRLYLWDVTTGQRLREFNRQAPAQDPRRSLGEVMSLFRVRGGFSPDGKSVAGLWWSDKLHVWDMATGKLRHHLGAAKGHTAFAFSPDGRFVALIGPEGAGLWETATGRLRRTFAGKPKAAPDPRFGGESEQEMFSMVFSPDGRMLVSSVLRIEAPGVSVEVQYLELASGRQRMRFHSRMDLVGGGGQVAFDEITSALDSFIGAFVFAPDGQTIAEAGLSNVKLRNLRSGKEVRAFGGKQIAAATARYSPDGKILIAGKHDGAVRLWDLATGTVLADLPAHQSGVTALAFSPDGKFLASGARDATVVIWDWDYIRRQAAAKSEPAPVKHQQLWADLAGDDAPKAYQAIKGLARAPETVAFLKARLRPVPPVDPRHLDKLVADLDHKQFKLRQKAEQDLEKLGDLAGPAIKGRLARAPSLEMARRLENLLKKLDAQVTTVEVLQTLRAIEVLELIGTADARQVLDGLAKGAAGHRVTEEAGLSVERMTRKLETGR